jgi:hypothetical protein
MAIEWMVEKHGIERVGLLTLSFGVLGSGLRGSLETFLLREQAKLPAFRFGKGDFKTGMAAKVLNLFAENPWPLLNVELKQ